MVIAGQLRDARVTLSRLLLCQKLTHLAASCRRVESFVERAPVHQFDPLVGFVDGEDGQRQKGHERRCRDSRNGLATANGGRSRGEGPVHCAR